MSIAAAKSADRRFLTAIALLRICAVTTVVLLHVAMAFALWCDESAGLDLLNSMLKGICFWAVPIFVIMSGYCLLGRDFEIGEFYLKRCRRILLPTLTWSGLYFALRYFSRSGLSLDDILYSLLSGGAYYHLWFMYMLIGLYLLAPLCRWVIKRLGVRIWWWIAAFWLIVGCCGQTVWEMPVMKLFGLKSLPYLGLFIAGGALRTGELCHKWQLAGLLLGVAYLLGAGPVMSYLRWRYGFDGSSYYYYTGLATSLGSLAIFVAGMHWLEFERCPDIWKKRLNAAGNLAFGVYLVHPALLVLCGKLLERFEPGFGIYAALSLVVLGGSWEFAWTVDRIPYVGRLLS